MSESTSTYQGYTNYETFSIAVVGLNDFDTYNAWLSDARYAMSPEGQAEIGEECGGVWDEGRERARIWLGMQIKEAMEDGNPLAEANSVYSALLNAALESVNWDEIADELLDKLEDK